VPWFARPVTDERDGLLVFLGQQRQALRAAVVGLSDEQARAQPAAGSLCLGGLLKHASRGERRWVVAGIAGRPLPGLWPPADWSADFRMDDGETVAGLLAHYAETEQMTGRIVGEITDMGQPSAINAEQSVRWVLLTLIQETARHAGHADMLRETLDGKQAGQLLDSYDVAAPG